MTIMRQVDALEGRTHRDGVYECSRQAQTFRHRKLLVIFPPHLDRHLRLDFWWSYLYFSELFDTVFDPQAGH